MRRVRTRTAKRLPSPRHLIFRKSRTHAYTGDCHRHLSTQSFNSKAKRSKPGQTEHEHRARARTREREVKATKIFVICCQLPQPITCNIVGHAHRIMKLDSGVLHCRCITHCTVHVHVHVQVQNLGASNEINVKKASGADARTRKKEI